jgi:hypothetical protein
MHRGGSSRGHVTLSQTGERTDSQKHGQHEDASSGTETEDRVFVGVHAASLFHIVGLQSGSTFLSDMGLNIDPRDENTGCHVLLNVFQKNVA